MSQHTPGPWSLSSSDKEIRQQIVTGGIAIKAYNRRFDAECAIFNIPSNEAFGGFDEAVANARLIGAAPDLLNALKEFLHPYQSGSLTERERNEKAQAAIAKAEGLS